MQGLCLKYAEAAPAASGESSQLGSPLGFTQVSHPTRSNAFSTPGSPQSGKDLPFEVWRPRHKPSLRVQGERSGKTRFSQSGKTLILRVKFSKRYPVTKSAMYAAPPSLGMVIIDRPMNG